MTKEIPSPDFIGQKGHGPDERAHDLVGDILHGRVTRPAREQIRDALGHADKADAAAPKPFNRGAMRLTQEGHQLGLPPRWIQQ